MVRLLVRILLSALAFTFVLPMVKGISFHGSYLDAVWLALWFGILFFLVDLALKLVSAVVTVGTFGLALVILIPLWLLGFWLLPAVALKILADVMPSHLTVGTWGAAILGGLVMLGISAVTSPKVWQAKKKI